MPSAAERTRTLVQSTCSATLLLPGPERPLPFSLMPDERTVGPDGEILLVFPESSPAVRAAAPAQDDELAAVLEVTDVAPVSVPHRVRGRVRVSGWLTRVPGSVRPGRATLRLETDEMSVDDLWGAEQVDPEAFTVARPDPLAAHETELLQHLASAHTGQVWQLRALLGERAGTLPADTVPVPLALDRFGLRVRFVGPRPPQTFDARFEFPQPVADTTGLRRAMRFLFAAAHDS